MAVAADLWPLGKGRESVVGDSFLEQAAAIWIETEVSE